jgi:prefoldin beta subunit
MEESSNINLKIQDLQLMEQGLQSLMLQKQSIQVEVLDIENALDELKDSTGESYKIVGPVMVSVSKSDLEKDLNEKKKILNLRINSIEKQEEETKSRLIKLREEVIKGIDKAKKSSS